MYPLFSAGLSVALPVLVATIPGFFVKEFLHIIQTWKENTKKHIFLTQTYVCTLLMSIIIVFCLSQHLGPITRSIWLWPHLQDSYFCKFRQLWSSLVQIWNSGKLPFECQKIAKNLTFFQKIAKKENFWQFFLKCQVFGNFLTFKMAIFRSFRSELNLTKSDQTYIRIL